MLCTCKRAYPNTVPSYGEDRSSHGSHLHLLPAYDCSNTSQVSAGHPNMFLSPSTGSGSSPPHMQLQLGECCLHERRAASLQQASLPLLLHSSPVAPPRVQSSVFCSTKTTAPKHTHTVHSLLAVDQSASEQNQTNPPPSIRLLSFEKMLLFQSLK